MIKAWVTHASVGQHMLVLGRVPFWVGQMNAPWRSRVCLVAWRGRVLEGLQAKGRLGEYHKEQSSCSIILGSYGLKC